MPNGPQWATIVLFFIANAVVAIPFSVPCPRSSSSRIHSLLVRCRIVRQGKEEPRFRVAFNFKSAPLIIVLILLAAQCIHGEDIRIGIVGSEGIQPLDIMALFFSLAYLSISLDVTGLFRFLAYWVADKGGHSGRRLYIYLYVFFLALGIIVGNDPVILAGTPFLSYLTTAANIDHIPWVFAQFAAANTAACVLVSANPTNLVLTGAFNITFLSYTAHVIIPFLISAAFLFVPLFIMFSRRIPASLDKPPMRPRQALVDPFGAVFGTVLFAVTLIMLVGTSPLRVPVWEITVPPAVIMVVRDVWYDLRRPQDERVIVNPLAEPSALPPVLEADSLPDEKTDATTNSQDHAQADSPASSKTLDGDRMDNRRISSETPNEKHLEQSSMSGEAQTQPKTMSDVYHRFQHFFEARFPTIATIAPRLPIALLPFAFLMFTLVQGLNSSGWVEIFASGWVKWVNHTGVLGAIGGMGFMTCFFCNVAGTNIGATILLSRVLQVWINTHSPSPREREGAIYALAIGSNFGAYTAALSASLAGLLWQNILSQKGKAVDLRKFPLYNAPLIAVSMVVGCLVLFAQVHVTHR